MTRVALLFLVISVAVVWGGLVASILYLRAHPIDDVPDEADDAVPRHGGGPAPRA